MILKLRSNLWYRVYGRIAWSSLKTVQYSKIPKFSQRKSKWKFILNNLSFLSAGADEKEEQEGNTQRDV